MATHFIKSRGKRSTLLSFEGVSLKTPYGTVYGNVEVTLDVKVRVDPKDYDECPWSESGRDDLQRVVNECAERISAIYTLKTGAAAPAAQAELVFSLEEPTS